MNQKLRRARTVNYYLCNLFNFRLACTCLTPPKQTDKAVMLLHTWATRGLSRFTSSARRILVYTTYLPREGIAPSASPPHCVFQSPIRQSRQVAKNQINGMILIKLKLQRARKPRNFEWHDSNEIETPKSSAIKKWHDSNEMKTPGKSSEIKTSKSSDWHDSN